MSTTTNPRSLLYELRRVVPRRPLPLGEARQVAELQANRLLLACGIDEPGTPTEIIERLSYVQVSIRADMPTSGYSDWYKPHWLIMLNAAEPDVRRRFTLMHEFKHVLDHPFIDSLYLGRSAKECKDRAEQTADYFAACVLMPKRLVKRLFGQGHQSVSDLAACFGVSEVAMAFRLRQLGLSEPVPRCSYQASGGPAPGADEVELIVRGFLWVILLALLGRLGRGVLAISALLDTWCPLPVALWRWPYETGRDLPAGQHQGPSPQGWEPGGVLTAHAAQVRP